LEIVNLFKKINKKKVNNFNKKEKMSRTTFEQLLEAGAHFGHLKRKWNPAMAPYIFMERNGIHIIDLHKTVVKIDEAAETMKTYAKQGKKVLFVATKKQAKEVVAEKAKQIAMPYITERWAGGMLTNFPTIRKAVKKMSQIDKMTTDGTFDNISKREKLQITRQREKLEKNLGSIADMVRLPAAVFVVDVMKEHIAVAEALRLGIPVFGIIDTNSDPTGIDYLIPANDDSTKTIEIVFEAMVQAYKEGLDERKVEKIDNKEHEEETEQKVRSKTRLVRRSSHRSEKKDALNTEVADNFKEKED
jgi:small subunit ribosomal protein S2